jgi:hypothetical protein
MFLDGLGHAGEVQHLGIGLSVNIPRSRFEVETLRVIASPGAP